MKVDMPLNKETKPTQNCQIEIDKKKYNKILIKGLCQLSFRSFLVKGPNVYVCTPLLRGGINNYHYN